MTIHYHCDLCQEPVPTEHLCFEAPLPRASGQYKPQTVRVVLAPALDSDIRADTLVKQICKMCVLQALVKATPDVELSLRPNQEEAP